MIHEVIGDRYIRFCLYNGLDYPNQDSFVKFMDYYETRGDPRKEMNEEEQVRTYSNYRFLLGKKASKDDVHRMLLHRFTSIYDRKNFRKIVSRKSMDFIHKHHFIKAPNLYAIVKGRLTSLGIDIYFLSLQKVQGTLGTLYFLDSSFKFKKNGHICYTQHFFDRYALRDSVAGDPIEKFIKYEINFNANHSIINSYNQHATISTNNGIGAGHKIKDLIIIKTFVESVKLGPVQILELLHHKIYAEGDEYVDKIFDYTKTVPTPDQSPGSSPR